jgi:hypothetical protein
MGRMRSMLSTPFCNVITRVFGPTSARACSAAFSVSHSIDRSDVGWVVRRVDGFEMQVAVDAVDLEAVLAQRRQICAARNEAHIMAGRRERTFAKRGSAGRVENVAE